MDKPIKGSLPPRMRVYGSRRESFHRLTLGACEHRRHGQP